ncbi:MAG TPA: YkgJ family cysteine cluster protein [Sphingomonas sp.]
MTALDTHFACTACGRCCHDLKLLLDVGEAVAWTRRGGRVQILCEAIPWPAEPADDDAQGRYKRDRAFAATSGGLPVRITVLLVATFDGACPNLRADLLCDIYEQRPTVCRIYPAEISPFVAFARESKACPPDAWMPRGPLLVRAGWVADAETAALIALSRAAAAAEIDVKARLCARLGIAEAALANEGFAIHTPDGAALIDALAWARTAPGGPAEPWRIASNRATTLAMLADAGADGVPAEGQIFDYLGFFPADYGQDQPPALIG